MIQALNFANERFRDPECHPRPIEVLTRIIIGIPTLTAGGTLVAALLEKVTALSVSTASGAIFGATYGVVNTITSVYCNAVGIELKHPRSNWRMKVILDTALSAMIAFAICTKLAVPISIASASILVPGLFLGSGFLMATGFYAGIVFQTVIMLMIQEMYRWGSS